MDTALTLFEINGVCRKIPVDDGMTELMKVQSLLTC
jgi:hypothetical protein